MHPTESKIKYNHSIAAYPLQWHTYVVSPKKICIQFKGMQLKTRIKDRDYSDTRKTQVGSYSIDVDTHGTGIDVLALGIPLGMYPEVLCNLLKAFKEHADMYDDNLKEFLLSYSDDIKKTFEDNK